MLTPWYKGEETGIMSISVDNDTMQVDENYNGPDKLMHHTLALFPILKAALFMNNCVAFQTEKYI